MNRWYSEIAACIACVSAAHAQDRAPDLASSAAPAQQIMRADTQPAVTGSPDYFTGRVVVVPLFPANAYHAATGAYVTFAPGARSAWHTHPGGQRLVVVSGVGLTQEWGQRVQVIRPGDVVWCPPGVRHWHGAAPATAMTHLAVTGVVDGKSVIWMEKVTDD